MTTTPLTRPVLRPRALPVLLLALGAASAQAQLRVSAAFAKPNVVSGEELCLRIVFENAGKAPLAMVRPATLDSETLRLRITDAAGRDFAAEGRREPPPGLDDLSRLAPGQKLDLPFDLHGLFLTGLPPGEYTYSVAYDCPVSRFPVKTRDLVDLKAESPPAKLTVTPRSAAQEDEAKRFEAAFRAPDLATQVARCRETLAAHPRGLFALRLRMLLAMALSKTGGLDEAVVLYSHVLADPDASPATQTTCRMKLALVHRERGELQTAIELMRQVDSRQARQFVVNWTRELEARRP